jgi:hypothetical protein
MSNTIILYAVASYLGVCKRVYGYHGMLTWQYNVGTNEYHGTRVRL